MFGNGLSLIVTFAHVSSCSVLLYSSYLLTLDSLKHWFLPLACPSSPAVSSASVASFGNCSRTTDAAIVRGMSVALSSGSTGASGGDAEDEVEVILPALWIDLTPVGWNALFPIDYHF